MYHEASGSLHCSPAQPRTILLAALGGLLAPTVVSCRDYPFILRRRWLVRQSIHTRVAFTPAQVPDVGRSTARCLRAVNLPSVFRETRRCENHLQEKVSIRWLLLPYPQNCRARPRLLRLIVLLYSDLGPLGSIPISLQVQRTPTLWLMLILARGMITCTPCQRFDYPVELCGLSRSFLFCSLALSPQAMYLQLSLYCM